MSSVLLEMCFRFRFKAWGQLQSTMKAPLGSGGGTWHLWHCIFMTAVVQSILSSG